MGISPFVYSPSLLYLFRMSLFVKNRSMRSVEEDVPEQNCNKNFQSASARNVTAENEKKNYSIAQNKHNNIIILHAYKHTIYKLQNIRVKLCNNSIRIQFSSLFLSEVLLNCLSCNSIVHSKGSKSMEKSQ